MLPGSYTDAYLLVSLLWMTKVRTEAFLAALQVPLVSLGQSWLTSLVLPLHRGPSRSSRIGNSQRARSKHNLSQVREPGSVSKLRSISYRILVLFFSVDPAGTAMKWNQKRSSKKIFICLALLTKLLSASLVCGSETRTETSSNSQAYRCSCIHIFTPQW